MIEIPREEMIDYVQQHCSPAEVFDDERLGAWAEENGWGKLAGDSNDDYDRDSNA
jgi:hypothetical protein